MRGWCGAAWMVQQRVLWMLRRRSCCCRCCWGLNASCFLKQECLKQCNPQGTRLPPTAPTPWASKEPQKQQILHRSPETHLDNGQPIMEQGCMAWRLFDTLQLWFFQGPGWRLRGLLLWLLLLLLHVACVRLPALVLLVLLLRELLLLHVLLYACVVGTATQA